MSSSSSALVAGVILVGVRHWSIEALLPPTPDGLHHHHHHHAAADERDAADASDEHARAALARIRRHHERELGLPPGGAFDAARHAGGRGGTAAGAAVRRLITGGYDDGDGAATTTTISTLLAATAVVWLVAAAVRWATSTKRSATTRAAAASPKSSSTLVALSTVSCIAATCTLFSLCRLPSLSTGSIVGLPLAARAVWRGRAMLGRGGGEGARWAAWALLALSGVCVVFAGVGAGAGQLLLAYAAGVAIVNAGPPFAIATGATSAVLAWMCSNGPVPWTPAALVMLVLLGAAVGVDLPGLGALVGDAAPAVDRGSPTTAALFGIIASEIALDVFQPVDGALVLISLALAYLFHRCSTPVPPQATFFAQAWRHLSSSDESRRIFLFLLLNLAYMLVQVAWGIWTNSLGLISDAIHMGFDCLSLGLGLVASVMSQRPADGTYTYGWGRLQALSGFTNGVFLVLISLFIIVEALQRLVTPPEIRNIRQLLAVSTGGLVVNLVGMVATGHHHHGGHDHHHHDHHHHDHGHDHGHNMRGVFLHVLADTLGSAGVIASTLLISYTGWTIFDPLASLFMASMIAASVAPLIKDTYGVLALENDAERARRIDHALSELPASVESVSSYGAARFWPRDAGSLVGTIHVRLDGKSKVDVSRSMAQIEAFLMSRVPGLEEVVVQVEQDGATFCSCTTQYQ